VPLRRVRVRQGNITKEEAEEFQMGMLRELADKRPTGWEQLLDDLELFP